MRLSSDLSGELREPSEGRLQRLSIRGRLVARPVFTDGMILEMKKLFWDDPYRTSNETIVESVQGRDVTVRESVFFACSGGQESDSETIGRRDRADTDWHGRTSERGKNGLKSSRSRTNSIPKLSQFRKHMYAVGFPGKDQIFLYLR